MERCTGARTTTDGSGSPPPEGYVAQAGHATILKCDLVGSTRAKRTLDLSGQLEFQRLFEEIISGVAEQHGAHIEAFEGDGALVVFGYPNPREDAAESAVSMGLDLIDAVRGAELLPKARLQLRVGVASGLVAVAK